MTGGETTDLGNGSSAWTPGQGTDAADKPSWSTEDAASLVAERPEIAVGAAFLGGLIAARIIKRLGR
jgi:hypothetical protein